MAEKIFDDSGLCIDWGRTQQEYENDPDWDPLIMSVVDTSQTFTAGRIYQYFPVPDLFYETGCDRKCHAIYLAWEPLFTALRWGEIQDILDSYGVRELVWAGDIPLVRHKIDVAEADGKITTAEETALLGMIAHY